MGKTAKKIAVGALVAGVAGYVAGVLTAPKSGKETRKDIKKAANKAVTEAEHKLKQLHSDLTDLVKKGEKEAAKVTGKAKDALAPKLKAAQTAKNKASELLSALHDGDADSKELKAAVTEIKAARDHLKAFFKQ
jgi:gas vesicle protein